jgi:hypothetical protein
MIEFETMDGSIITACAHAVLYTRQRKDKTCHVVLQGDPEGTGWEVDKANYEKVRAAIRGFDQESADASD